MTAALQHVIDVVLESSRQQWLLRAAVLLSPIAAVLAVSGAQRTGADPGVVVVVAAMAVAATAIPDSQLPTVVIALVGWQWLAHVDSVSSPWLPVAVICLVVHHTAAALTSTVPTGGVLPWDVVGRWVGRVAACAGLVVFVWTATTILDGRDAAGNGLLTGLALVVAAGLATFVRSRSLGRGTSVG
ncbi:MAG: hypothetical protein AAGA17_20545 [Actinomycetota bacterium]